MKADSSRILIAGHFPPGALEISYANAFRELGCEIQTFDLVAFARKYSRFGKLGRTLNTFVPVGPWMQKVSRDLFLQAQSFQPDLLIVVGRSHVEVGALAQMSASLPAKRALIWPDSLVNIAWVTQAAVPLYDLVATYSQASIRPFQRMGAEQVVWVPLAGDPTMYPKPGTNSPLFDASISFVGSWRPEREEILALLLKRFPELEIKIWGPEWGRRSKNPAIHRVWQQRPLYGAEFGSVVKTSRLNLNIIDPTNFPAANMRFFELFCAGGLQVCSACPEMEGEFKHNETVCYYHEAEELVCLVQNLLQNETRAREIAERGHSLVLEKHTYRHRAEQILELLGLR